MIAPRPKIARRKTAAARRRFILPVFLTMLAAALLLAGCGGAPEGAHARIRGQWDMGTGMTRSR